MARILIVDDHIETCRIMAMLVKHLGHEAHALSSGAEVSGFLKKTHVDLVILDIMMPGVSGMDVLKQVRSDPETSDVPVVMMTAVTDPLTRREAMGLGANDYWIKATIEMDELERRLNKYTGGGTDGPDVTVHRMPLRPLIDTAKALVNRWSPRPCHLTT